ncbi:V-set and immunoglobulin domain-containing protein 1-like isoform X2 [Siniperca chuatsi]|uniref:V-set and immunoglobulin domain-containing protein 1-like isoform X2 n=1 Tax=Siniperca chuatsi TaxID=119488 RepID=UPI001CE1CBBD|nr:V-set and immunoglobulin domain-containing protein 1-like isoform X2 [Siniperca chuatsi]
MQESVLRLRKVQFLRNSASVLQHSVKMFRLLVLISIIGCVELITVTTPQKYVNVTRGGSVLLQCMFVTTEQTNGLTIQWDFISPSSMRPQQVYYYQSGKDVITRSYEGRLQPPSSPGTTNNASVVISDMQPSDAGVYTCEVHNFPDVDGQSQANIIVNVLERPSAPYCSVHGDVESGHLVTLTCHSERGSPTPTYTWIRLDQTKTRRPVLGRMTKTGILEIRNISQFEFGEYQCNATNVVGFSTCTIELNHGGALLRPKKPQIAFPWQPQPATSMLREMSHKPKKRPVEINRSNVTILNNRIHDVQSLTYVIKYNQYDGAHVQV